MCPNHSFQHKAEFPFYGPSSVFWCLHTSMLHKLGPKYSAIGKNISLGTQKTGYHLHWPTKRCWDQGVKQHAHLLTETHPPVLRVLIWRLLQCLCLFIQHGSRLQRQSQWTQWHPQKFHSGILPPWHRGKARRWHLQVIPSSDTSQVISAHLVFASLWTICPRSFKPSQWSFRCNLKCL